MTIGKPPPSLIYNGSTSSSATASSFSFSNVPIGAATPDRQVFIAVTSGSASAPTSITFNGVAPTTVVAGSVNPGTAIYRLNVSSGTTINVAITYSGLVGGGQGIFSYSAYDLSNTAPVATSQDRNTTTNVVSLNLNTSANGFLIACSWNPNTSAQTATWSGATLNQTFEADRNHSAASLSPSTTATPRSLSVSWGGSINAVNGVAASFG